MSDPPVVRAVGIRRPGGPEVLEVIGRPVRQAGPGEVRIRVGAAAVNPADINLRRGVAAGLVDPPWTPGMDAAGTIESVGQGVERLAAGDQVMAALSAVRPEGGAQAELIVVPAMSVVRKPDGVSVAEAATLSMNGLTALDGLERLALVPGQTLAVTGAAGAVGSYAIQLAKRRGLTVIADAKPVDEDRVRLLGADWVAPRGARFAESVLDIVPDGVDAVFDTARLRRATVPMIRDGGQLAIAGDGNESGELERGITLRAVNVGDALARTDWLELLAAEAAGGRLQLRVAGEYPPHRAAAAHRIMEAGGLRGRVVIVF